jgi:membrane-associated protein
MDLLNTILQLLLHIDQNLKVLVEAYGVWIYLILFIVIFCETGLVVAPYLPGDSLLFVAGALAANLLLDPWILIPTLIVAAFLGDTVNYWIGHRFGMKVLDWNICYIRQEHIDRTRHFFDLYGGKTIVIARFLPFVRTFAPFLAGVGKMRYTWFLNYNIMGGILWVLAFVLGGYFFGNLPLVQDNFSIMIYAIIGLSLFAVASLIYGASTSFSSSCRKE